MSAKTRTKLVPRLYEPPPEPPTERLLTELIRRLERYDPVWQEMSMGDRGTDISKVCFSGARALATTSDPAGGYLVDSKTPLTAIEIIGAVLVAGRAGAITVPAEAADFSPLPRETTNPVLYWVAEGVPPPAPSDPVWGVIRPDIKTAVVWSDLSRLLTAITGKVADRIVTESFFRAIGRGIDKVIFHGTGADAQPTGIKFTENVGEVDGDTFSSLKAASMLRAGEDGDADTVKISWCMSPATAELLRTRERGAVGSDVMLVENDRMLGKPIFVSNSIDSGHLFCGDFSTVVILSRALELLVDRSSKSREGATRILNFWHGDILVTKPAALCFAQGVT